VSIIDFSPLKFPKGIPDYPNILIHRLADKELRDFYEENASMQACLLSNFKDRIEWLHDHFGYEASHKQWFEIPKQLKPYRFIRFNRIKLLDNLRIIYVLIDGNAYLLAATKEKRKSSYADAAELAKQRLDGLL